jgi:hypothetical protein
MARRIALAAAYTLFVLALLLTWPWRPSPPQVNNATVITSVPLARWLIILVPFYWGWVALSLETRRARTIALGASVALFVACLLLVWYHDNVFGPYADCLWHDGRCGPGWFN